MEKTFASRMSNTKESFIRQILKVTEKPEMISFAGGLPNPDYFPVAELKKAAEKVFREYGADSLQYSTTEGYPPLRDYIARRYFLKFGLTVAADDILITNGSQQGIDMAARILLDKGDRVMIEKPGYLGAIQAISLYEPEFHAVPMQEDGPDVEHLRKTLENNRIKMFYSVPNFQNPSGITYSRRKREQIARLLNLHAVSFVEDNPYGELRFIGNDLPLMKSRIDDQGILLGSFSKITVPGVRLGWICAGQPIMEKLIIAKQASDLHSNYLSQRIIYQYLQDNDLDGHILAIREAYKSQRDTMIAMIESHFPKEVSYTTPEGGMFLWVTLPKDVSSLELFNDAVKSDVAFVPGSAFHTDSTGNDSFRLNFSNSNEAKIEEGIKRLAGAIHSRLDKSRRTFGGHRVERN